MKTLGSLLLASILGAVLAIAAQHGISSGWLNEAKAAEAGCRVTNATNTTMENAASSLVSSGYKIVGLVDAGGGVGLFIILGCK